MANEVHVSQVMAELIMASTAVALPTGSNPGSNIWAASIDSVSPAAAGKNSLSIKLKDNQTIVTADGWVEKTVIGGFVPVSVPNSLIYGGQMNWSFTNKTPNLLFIISMGVYLYDNNYNQTAENAFDYNSQTDGTNAWMKIAEITLSEGTAPQFTQNVAFARYFITVRVSLVTGVSSFNTGTGNNYATMLFDNLYLEQRIGNTSLFPAAGGNGGTGNPGVPPGGTGGAGKTVTATGGHLSYVTTPGGNVTWTWVGVTVFWSDNTTTNVPDGSISQSGLTDGLLYYYFPYVDLATNTMKWLTGGVGAVGGGGFSDDFSTGTLNPGLWVIDAGSAPGNSGVNVGTFSAANVDLSQGVLDLKLTQSISSGIATSVGAEVRSIQQYGYGTYEWVYRAATTSTTPNGAGSSVSGSDSGGFIFAPNSLTEIDFEVEGQFPTQLELTNWVTTSSHLYSPYTMANASLAFHKYKFTWSAGRVDYYLDDALISTHTSSVPSASAWAMMNIWGTNSTSFGGVATVGTRHLYISKFTYAPLGTTSGGIAFAASTAGEIASQNLTGRLAMFPNLSAGTSGGPAGGGF